MDDLESWSVEVGGFSSFCSQCMRKEEIYVFKSQTSKISAKQLVLLWAKPFNFGAMTF